MDDIDKRIIDTLKKNSRTPITNIAEKIKLTEGAVRYRINEMLKKGEIKGFTVETKKRIEAIVLVSTKPEVGTEELSKSIKKISDVTDVYEVSGDYDIICMIKRESVQDVNNTIEKIRSIKGVLETVTYLVLRNS